MFCAATKKLRITADDEIVELYVDGVLTSFSAGGWETVRTVEIGVNTEVIAVKARDIAKVSDARRAANGKVRQQQLFNWN